MKTTLLAAAFALLAMPALAQSTDARWQPWIGCWTLATENLRAAEAQEGAPQRSARPTTAREGAPRVCVSSAGNGARFETTVSTQPVIDQTIVADGTSRPVNDADCSGTEHAEWSKSGLRLFSSAEIRCQGDEGLRRVSGISLIAPNGDWLDIQTVAIGPRESIRVKRYYRADDSPRSSPATVASSRLTLDEVKDASSKVSSAVLEAALVETNAGFNLSKKTVTDLASSGVSERVIDLLVALSYPEKFAIQRVGQAGGAPVPTTYARDPFFTGDPFYYDSYYYSPYYYQPFGYRYLVIDGGAFVGDGSGIGGGGSVPPPAGVGRVINGQGYTRVVPRESVPNTNAPTARTASTSTSGSAPSDAGSSSSSSSSGSSSSGSSSSGSSGGGATVSPSGASSGGSSDSGRTAVPR
jgi:hypothetical protein